MKKLHAAMAILLLILLVAPGCTPVSLDCAQPEVFCVGLVTDIGRRDDQAYNQAAWEGIQQAKSDGVADWIASIETIDARDYGENIRVFAEAGYDVIVTVGYDSGAATNAAAGKYSNIYFIGADQRQSGNQNSLPNLVWLVFPEDQLGFLAGALAAAMTQTGQVGAVCGSDAWLPMKSYGDGFIAGALYINPGVRATVTYHNDVGLDETFTDPVWGAAAANSLVDSGSDIIFGVGGTTGSNAIEAAAARGAYSIGADVDQYYLLPVASPRILTSVLKGITPALADLLKSAREAQTQTGIFTTGTFPGPIGYAPYHDLVLLIPDEVKQVMSTLPQALLSGEISTEKPVTAP
ncbi:MAG: BMP family ABC transporter substrate-binding protein [Chloroflexi bacterium]|nr:BMP family ABC transporter substrate-binding protein [Chloroflexota bacterium]